MYCAYIYAHKDKDIKIVTIDITMNNKQTFFPKILMSKTKISKDVCKKHNYRDISRTLLKHKVYIE